MPESYVKQIQNTHDLLSTKIAHPRLRSSLIPRDSLFAKLDSSLECKLALVCAPAGFGKTTLISMWLAQQRDKTANNPVVAWLSLDEGDNDPIRFWRYVLTASQQFEAKVGQTSLTALQNVQSVRLEAVLTTFINDLSTLADPCVLVLDDYHLIESSQIHETMTFLLEHLPATTHAVLISRSEPPLPLARLKASNEMLDLRAADLRFSFEESQRFLQQALPYSLPLSLVSHVQTRTDGWAVGLHLISLALQDQTEEWQRERIVMAFTGNYQPVREYLINEVLNRQPDAMQTFLLRSSVLSQLTASLCDVVTGGTRSDQVLEHLQKNNLFLVPLDEAGAWYRFHSLFTDAMQHEVMRRFGLDELRSLYGRASDWYEAHNMLSEAVETALRASILERAAFLIEKSIEEETFTKNRELYTLRRWLEQLPEQLIYEHPNLCFAFARVLLYTRAPRTLPNPKQIDRLLRIAEESWRVQNDPNRLGESLVFRSIFALLRGEHTEIVSNARQALRSLPQDNVVWRSISLNIIGTEELRDGQLNAARQTVLESLSLWEGTDANDAIQSTSLLLADIYIAQGELYQARALCNQVLKDEEKDELNPRKPLFKAKALIKLAALSYEWDDLERAEQHTRQAINFSRQVGDETLQVEAVLTQAHILHTWGQTMVAQRALADLMAQIPLSVPPLFWREILNCQAQIQLSTGNLAEVEQWLTTRHQYPLRLPAIQQEREDMLVARLLIAHGETDEAVRMLNSLWMAAHSAGRFRSTLEIRMITVLAHIARQDLEAATHSLETLLGRAHLANYRRLFLDERVAILPLLQSLLLEKRDQSVIASYIESLLAALHHPRGQTLSGNYVAPLFPEQLTAPEERVFSLFVNGLSKKEIANQLLISVNTVKTHLLHIYQKLNIRSRAEARAISRQAYRLE